MNDKQGTKEKILEVANKLFAKFGYHGTSVRDIAGESCTNIASINYHFKNKLCLYLKLFEENYKWMDENISNLDKDESLSTGELAWRLFNFFREHQDHLVNNMKIMVTEDVKIPEGLCKNQQFGPPGQDVFFKSITRDIGDQVPVEGRLWAVRIIFTVIVHSALMLSTSLVKDKMSSTPYLSEQWLELSIKSHVQATLEYLNKYPDKWKV